MKPEDLTKAPVVMIRVDKISTHPPNVRTSVGNVQALSRSIEDLGLIHPIIVTNDAKMLGDCGLPYALIVGKRRLAAAKFIKLTNISARIVTGPEAQDIVDLQTHENEQRVNLPAKDSATARYNEVKARVEEILGHPISDRTFRVAQISSKSSEIRGKTEIGALKNRIGRGIKKATKELRTTHPGRDRKIADLVKKYPELESFGQRSMFKASEALENAANGEERRNLRKFIVACEVKDVERSDDVSRAVHNLVNHWYLEHRTELLDKLEKHPDAILKAALGDPVSIPKAFYGLAELTDEITKAIEKYPWEKVAPSTKSEIKAAAKQFCAAVDLLKSGYDDARARLFASLKQ